MGKAGRSSATDPTVRMKATIPAASSAPTTSPMSDPMTPSTSAWVSMNDITCPRRAPAARRSPTSRIRSETVIDSVLKIRNAPANSAIAAIRAVVAWKSVVEARRAVARSSGDEST